MTSNRDRSLASALRFQRVLPTPPALVFEAFIDPAKINAWWGCSEATSVDSRIEPELGGRFEQTLMIEGCGPVEMVSRFSTYNPPLELAWRTEGNNSCPPTLTSIKLRPVANGTELTLIVEGLDSDFLQQTVSKGWRASLEKILEIAEAIPERVS